VKIKVLSQISPKNNENSSSGFYIMRYLCQDSLKNCPLAINEDGEDLNREVFVAKGKYPPRDTICTYDIEGHWEVDNNGRRAFVVESSTECLSTDREFIQSYLTKKLGIGCKIANNIFNEFGEDTFNVIENEPERLKNVKGIGEKNYNKLILNYNAEKGSKDIIMTLLPYGVSVDTATKIYEKYGIQSKDIITNHPYKLIYERNITFKVADDIAAKNNLSPYNIERLQAAIMTVLYQAEYGGELFRTTTGHLCVEFRELIQKTFSLLYNNVPYDQIMNAYNQLVLEKKIVQCYDPYGKNSVYFVYRKEVNDIETELAQAIVNMLLTPPSDKYINIDDEIRLMENKEKVSLAPEQINAVKTGLSNQFAVITGGPGTGKTTIIKFIRNIYMKNNPRKKILMCSPTGVAATRMSESTNGEASTVHKALELIANENGEYLKAPIDLDYDLIIVDETSMLDNYLAKVLVCAIKRGAKCLFIGDVDQLPSVGPGLVLKDIIASEVCPVAVLTKVYRQASGSLIPMNALLIKNGKSSFDYGEAFQFIPTDNFQSAASIMKDIYLKEVAVNGIENVMMLSPFRQKTETSVYSLNLLRDDVNPASPDKKEITCKSKVFREGDKVIQLQNVDNISNGDVGRIISIQTGETPTATIDFGHGRIKDYTEKDLEIIDWAYAMTVHKSQGSEAKVVIFNLLDGHGIMLKRNLLYTAVTRAKVKVYIVGQQSAIDKAVVSGVSKEDVRNTLLASKIRYLYNMKKAA